MMDNEKIQPGIGRITLDGGGAGIRTLGRVAPTTIFETVPFDRSGTPPFKSFCVPFLPGRVTNLKRAINGRIPWP